MLGAMLWAVGVVWFDYQLHRKDSPSWDGDEDDDGGHREPVLPTYPTSGLSIEDLLVDRLPDDGIFSRKETLCLN